MLLLGTSNVVTAVAVTATAAGAGALSAYSMRSQLRVFVLWPCGILRLGRARLAIIGCVSLTSLSWSSLRHCHFLRLDGWIRRWRHGHFFPEALLRQGSC